MTHATDERLLVTAGPYDAKDDRVDAVKKKIVSVPTSKQEQDCETYTVERHGRSPHIA